MKICELYKVDILGYNQEIGGITNDSTTLYEEQSLYPIGSKEYDEIETRQKLLCKFQSVEIDSTKGIKKKPIPKHWTKYRKIKDGEVLTAEQLEEIELNNKIIIQDRPDFMRYVYTDYNKKYRETICEFDRYCITKWGVKFDDLPQEFCETAEYKALSEYRIKKIGLLMTNGAMNKVCHHMEQSLTEVKQSNKNCDNDKIFNLLYNSNTDTDIANIPLIQSIQKKYNDFRKDKMLTASEFATYEQFYKVLRNEALATISNNIKELANLAVYLCYKMQPKKPKDFCWDCFGKGIYENLKAKKTTIDIPMADTNGNIEYLHQTYSLQQIYIKGNEPIETDEMGIFYGDEALLDDSNLTIFDTEEI